jgi:DNA-binding NarL/FixJ family response regulator
MTATPLHAGRVLVADADETSRAGLQALLARHDYETVTADTARRALALARDRQPDLAVLDVFLPDLSGYAVCHELRHRYGDTMAIIFVSAERVEAPDRVAGLLVGANDYIVKPFAPDELLARVRAALRHVGMGAVNGARLTPRQQEVLQQLAEGLTQAEIADRLVISPKTVASHIERILEKLRVHSRAEAVAAAYRRNLVRSRVPDADNGG